MSHLCLCLIKVGWAVPCATLVPAGRGVDNQLHLCGTKGQPARSLVGCSCASPQLILLFTGGSYTGAVVFLWCEHIHLLFALLLSFYSCSFCWISTINVCKKQLGSGLCCTSAVLQQLKSCSNHIWICLTDKNHSCLHGRKMWFCKVERLKSRWAPPEVTQNIPHTGKTLRIIKAHHSRLMRSSMDCLSYMLEGDIDESNWDFLKSGSSGGPSSA